MKTVMALVILQLVLATAVPSTLVFTWDNISYKAKHYIIPDWEINEGFNEQTRLEGVRTTLRNGDRFNFYEVREKTQLMYSHSAFDFYYQKVTDNDNKELYSHPITHIYIFADEANGLKYDYLNDNFVGINKL
jgi:hypothetical protein